MSLVDQVKKEIDGMSYEAMLSLWRFAPCPHPMFVGETGDYFKKIMFQKRDALPQGEAVAVSKSIGWR